MTTDVLNQLNSPLAVVLILGVVFGFVSMGLDKLTYFIRSIMKKTPTDTIAKSYDALVTILEKLNGNLERLNDKLDAQEKLADKNHEILEKGLGRIESRLR